MPQLTSPLDLLSLNGHNGFRLDGSNNENAGQAVATGDINGDGYDDVIVAAQHASPDGVTNAGSIYVFFGKERGFADAKNLSSLNGENGFRLDGANASEFAGVSVSSGDFNGDSYDDVMIGSNQVNDLTGTGYVFFGRAAGFHTSYDLDVLNGKNGFAVPGTSDHSLMGTSVSLTGDFNGDGKEDVLISAYNLSQAYVGFGTGRKMPASFDVTSLDGKNGFRIDNLFGASNGNQTAASAGDVNGDGIDDIVVGVAGLASNSGGAHVIFGHHRGFAADLDVQTMGKKGGFHISGYQENSFTGFNVGSAGDINNDGIGDFMLGAFAADTDGHIDNGAVFVIFGTTAEFPRHFNLRSLDGANGFRVDGAADNTYLGNAGMASVGDVNGDGIDDLLFGQSNSGSAYVLYGRAASFGPTVHLSNLGNKGLELTNTGSSASAAGGDINGDGDADLVLGSLIGHNGTGSLSGTAYVVFGVHGHQMQPEPMLSVDHQGIAGHDFEGDFHAIGGMPHASLIDFM